jgi:cytochrome c oxidase subunit 2
MIGTVTVMEPAAFQAWLSGGATGTSLAAAGEKLFQDLACITCHRADSEGRGPKLEGVFGHPVSLTSGERVIADEAYVRESIVNPAAKVVAGFQPVMPTYQGLVSEESLMQLVAYIQSLGGPAPAGPGAALASPAPAPAPPAATPGPRGPGR